jgi:hypothetical protein
MPQVRLNQFETLLARHRPTAIGIGRNLQAVHLGPVLISIPKQNTDPRSCPPKRLMV